MLTWIYRCLLLIGIPAHNEQNTIEEVVTRCRQFGEVLVVDDFSTDDTERLAKKSGAKVIRSDEKIGYDAALGLAFEHGKKLHYKFIITFDADGQMPAKDISAFYRTLLNGKDLVIGNRTYLPRFSELIFFLDMQLDTRG